MANEQLDDENTNDIEPSTSFDEVASSNEAESLEDTSPLDNDGSKRSGIALVWRILALGVALVIIVILAYPYIQQQFRSIDNPSGTSPTVPTEVSILENEASSPEEWFELGKDHYKQNQWSQAVTAFQKVIELDPTYQAAYANLGATYHRQNNLDLAVAQYQKALGKGTAAADPILQPLWKP